MLENKSDPQQLLSEPNKASDMGAIPEEEYVRWAYRLLHGREPESETLVHNHPYKNNRELLLQSILESEEFNINYGRLLSKMAKGKGQDGNASRQMLDTDALKQTFYRDALAFVHVPKTGGTTLHQLLAACYPGSRICPERFARLHLHPIAELAKYDFFSGHFDYFAVRFIPRRRVRCVSIFRDPCRRLISWYRFCQATPVTGEFADYIPVRLAHELDPSAFFEHQAIRSRTDANNAYLFYLSSLAVDPLTLDSVFLAYDGSTLRGPLPGSGTQAPGHMDKDILAPAVKQLLALDGIGITERFGESVELIFSALGLPIPESIAPMMVTDQLPNLAPGYSPVPPVEMTPRLSRALGPLTHYDRVIYNAAKREFERRLARRQEQPPILAAKDTLIPSGSMGS